MVGSGVKVCVGIKLAVGDMTGVGGMVLVGVGRLENKEKENPPPAIHNTIITMPKITRMIARIVSVMSMERFFPFLPPIKFGRFFLSNIFSWFFLVFI